MLESDSNKPIRLSVIIPLYNMSQMVEGTIETACRYLDALQIPCELLLIDDGSRDGTSDRARKALRSRPPAKLISLPKNRGKGAAVSAGMTEARGDYRVFLDADLAYPIEEIGKIFRALSEGADVAIACRVLDESRFIMSPNFFRYLYTRHVMGRIFNLIVRMLVLPDILDTQAGLKGFTRKAASTIFPRLTLQRFSFDVEVLRIAKTHDLSIAQVPITFGYFHEASTVRFFRDTLKMLADLIYIRVKNSRGDYAAAPLPSDRVLPSNGETDRVGRTPF